MCHSQEVLKGWSNKKKLSKWWVVSGKSVYLNFHFFKDLNEYIHATDLILVTNITYHLCSIYYIRIWIMKVQKSCSVKILTDNTKTNIIEIYNSNIYITLRIHFHYMNSVSTFKCKEFKYSLVKNSKRRKQIFTFNWRVFIL